MPQTPEDVNKDRLSILLQKAIKDDGFSSDARTAAWVALLEPLCDAELPADWRDTYEYP